MPGLDDSLCTIVPVHVAVLHGETVPEEGYPYEIEGESRRQNRPVVLIPMFYACRTGCELITDNVLKTLAMANTMFMLSDGSTILQTARRKQTAIPLPPTSTCAFFHARAGTDRIWRSPHRSLK